MYKRVYNSYKIKITDDEDVRYVSKEGFNPSSYKDVIKLYRETKEAETKLNNSCRVELVGVTDDDLEISIFIKNLADKDNSDQELCIKTEEILDNIKYNLELLKKKKEYHRNMMSYHDKKQEMLLHKVETIKKLKADKASIQREKLKIFDRIEQVRDERRFSKMEDKKIKTVCAKLSIDDFLNQLSEITINSDDNYEYIDVQLEENIIKEVPYYSEKDRVKKMKSLNKNYKKIINDSVNKKLICSNTGYHSNK